MRFDLIESGSFAAEVMTCIQRTPKELKHWCEFPNHSFSLERKRSTSCYVLQLGIGCWKGLNLKVQCFSPRHNLNEREPQIYRFMWSFLFILYSPNSGLCPLNLWVHDGNGENRSQLLESRDWKLSRSWFISANAVINVSFDQFFCQPLILHHCKLKNKFFMLLWLVTNI